MPHHSADGVVGGELSATKGSVLTTERSIPTTCLDFVWHDTNRSMYILNKTHILIFSNKKLSR